MYFASAFSLPLPVRDVIWYHERMRPTDPNGLPGVPFSSLLLLHYLQAYISISPPPHLSPPGVEPSLCFSQSWLSQQCAPQSQHLSGTLDVVQTPSDRSFWSVDLNALAAFSRLIRTGTLRVLVVLTLCAVNLVSASSVFRTQKARLVCKIFLKTKLSRSSFYGQCFTVFLQQPQWLS